MGGWYRTADMLPQDSRLGVPGVPLPQSEQFVCELLAATARGNPQKDRVSHVLVITDVDHSHLMMHSMHLFHPIQ